MDMTPGFYQGRSQGIKTGRPSPRVPLRPARSDLINAAHGIVSIGSIDPHQGQLFNTEQMPALSKSEVVSRAGGAPYDRLADHKGFMPMLDTHKQKINAINRLSEARVRTGADRNSDTKDYSGAAYRHQGEPLKSGRSAKKEGVFAGQANRGVPVREAMQDVSSGLSRSWHSDWYAGRDEATGHLTPGHAGDLIEGIASRQGVSHSSAIRTVAIVSPRTHWDNENAGPVGHSYGLSRPNLNSAEHVIQNVKALGPDPSSMRASLAGSSSYGKALGNMKAKAGVELAKGEPHNTIPVYEAASAKVPNFDQSLRQDNPSKAVQEQAARSYTVDVHAVHSMGGDEKMLKSAPGYAIAGLIGRRAAHRAGELAPVGQSMGWTVQRGDDAVRSMGTHGLFTTNRKGGIIPNPLAIPGLKMRSTLTSDDRSPTAKKYGLEF